LPPESSRAASTDLATDVVPLPVAPSGCCKTNGTGRDFARCSLLPGDDSMSSLRRWRARAGCDRLISDQSASAACTNSLASVSISMQSGSSGFGAILHLNMPEFCIRILIG
jgi:hypothetical protein